MSLLQGSQNIQAWAIQHRHFTDFTDLMLTSQAQTALEQFGPTAGSVTTLTSQPCLLCQTPSQNCGLCPSLHLPLCNSLQWRRVHYTLEEIHSTVKTDYGTSARKALMEKNKCKPFSWYLKICLYSTRNWKELYLMISVVFCSCNFVQCNFHYLTGLKYCHWLKSCWWSSVYLSDVISDDLLLLLKSFLFYLPLASQPP